MSVEAMTWAWSQTVGDAGAKAVLVALANFADEDGRCWPGVARLAHMTDQGERTVRRHLATLIEGAFIKREPRYVKTTGARDRDAFVFLAPPEQLTKTRGPHRTATPGQIDRSGQSGKAPRPKPPVTLTIPPANGALPPGQSGNTPRPTVAGHKDDPSKNLQSTRAREADGSAPVDGALPEFAFEVSASAIEHFRQRWHALREDMGAGIFEGWFSGCLVLAIEPVVRLQVQNAFHAETINERYGRKFRKAFGEDASVVAAPIN